MVITRGGTVARTTGQNSPAAEQNSPAAEQNSPAAEQNSPAAEQNSPAAEQNSLCSSLALSFLGTPGIGPPGRNSPGKTLPESPSIWQRDAKLLYCSACTTWAYDRAAYAGIFLCLF